MATVSSVDLIGSNRILRFLCEPEGHKNWKSLKLLVRLWGGPIVVLVIAGVSGVLYFPSASVGMLQDYLFMWWAFGTIPALVLLLRVILRRFGIFLDAIPSFTKGIIGGELEKVVVRYVAFVAREGTWQKILKYFVGVAAFISNTSAIYHRSGVWNSPDYPLMFWVTVVFFAVMYIVVMPQVLMKYLVLILAQIKLTRELVESDKIEIRPIAPDRSGGLRSLGELALAFTYFIAPFVIQLVVHYFTWRVFSTGFLLGLSTLLPLSVFVFFYPLGVVHKAMSEAKGTALKDISERYLLINRELLSDVRLRGNDTSLLEKKQVLDLLEKMYDKTDAMPVWPFNTKTLARFFAVTLGPLAAVFLEIVVQRIVGIVVR